MFTERNPCEACGRTIKTFQQNIKKRFDTNFVEIYSYFGKDKMFYSEYHPEIREIKEMNIRAIINNVIFDVEIKNPEIQYPVRFYKFNELSRLKLNGEDSNEGNF